MSTESHVRNAINNAFDAAIASVLADAETLRLFPAAFDAGDDNSEAVREYNDACDAAEGALESLRDAIASLRRSIDRALDKRAARVAVRSAVSQILASDIPQETRAGRALSIAY